MLFIILLFIVLVGGGWIIGKSAGNLLFKSKDYYQPHYDYDDSITKPKIYKKEFHAAIKPKVKLSAEEIIKKIETVTLQTKENRTSIYFDNVTENNLKYLPMFYNETGFIGIGLKIMGNKILIEVASSNFDIKLYKGAELSFHFDNHEILTYKFQTGNIKGHLFNLNLIIPSARELEYFAFNNLEYWSLKYEKKEIMLEGDNTFFPDQNRLHNKADFQEVLKFLSQKIVSELIRINENAIKY